MHDGSEIIIFGFIQRFAFMKMESPCPGIRETGPEVLKRLDSEFFRLPRQ